jgi:hypothetical protein
MIEGGRVQPMTVNELAEALATAAEVSVPNGGRLVACSTAIGKVAGEALMLALGGDTVIHSAIELTTVAIDRGTEKLTGELSWWFALDRDLLHFVLRVRSKSASAEYPMMLTFHGVGPRTRVVLHVGAGRARLIVNDSLVLDDPDARFFHAVQRIRAQVAG